MDQIFTLLSGFQSTPVPGLLAGAGVIFIFIAIMGQFAWQIKIGVRQQILAALMGMFFLCLGVSLYLAPVMLSVVSQPAANVPVSQPPASTASANPQPTMTASQMTKLYHDAPVLFEDDFESNQDGWKTGESSDEFSTDAAEVNGVYHRSMTSKKGVIWAEAVPGVQIKDFYMSVEATLVETTANDKDASISLVFRKDRSGNYYRIRFNRDGSYIVNLNKDGEWVTLQGWRTTEAVHLDPGVKNTFVVQARGNEFVFLVNDTYLTTVRDDFLADNGTIALAMGLDKADQTLVVEFDNLVIREIK